MLGRDHHPEANVELALAYEQGPLDVLLQDEDVRFDVRGVSGLRLLVCIISIA